MGSDGVRFRYPQIALLYVSSVMVLTLILLFAGFSSLQSQRQEIDNLNLGQLQLHLERLGYTVENRLWEHAHAALALEILEPLTTLVFSPDGEERESEIQALLQSLGERHPIARQWLVLQGERVLFLADRDHFGKGAETGLAEKWLTEALGGLQAASPRRAAGRGRSASPSPPRLRPGETHFRVVRNADRTYPIFYRTLPDSTGESVVDVGFAVDLDWMQEHVFGEVRKDFARVGQLDAVLRPAAPQPAAAEAGPDAHEGEAILFVPFRSVLQGWTLHVPQSTVEEHLGSLLRGTRALMASGAILVCVLVIGSVLISRALGELRLSQMRSNYFNAVSHELKTPVTLIRLYTETLANDPTASVQERDEYCEIITQQSERLGHVMDQLLSFSQVQSGRREYDLREGDLASAAAQVVNSYVPYLRRCGFEVVLELAARVPPIRFDAEAVSQAVLNLLDNARKYSGESRFIAARLFSQGDRVFFEVADRGPGIAPEERNAVFKPFYRGSQASGKGGHGLGLYLVQHIMQAHGGKIEVESQVGRGSAFRLVFPTAVPADKPLKEAAGSPAAA